MVPIPREPAADFHPGLEVLEGDLDSRLASAFLAEPAVACDLETTGLDWQRDRIGTVQLYGPSVGTVIIRARSETPMRLRDLVAHPDVTKVFHHAPFDLRFMQHHWGISAAGVKCTKIASKLSKPAAPAGRHSLAALAGELLDVSLLKGAVRTSDWGSASSLSDEQTAYAANDVRYLLSLLERLEASLVQCGLLDLYQRCCDFLPSQTLLEVGGYPDVFAY